MAAQAYDVFFGTTAAGGTPAFDTYVDNDLSSAIVPQPTINDIGGGFYRFEVNWDAIDATHIRYSMSLAGFPDQWDLITSPAAEDTAVTITSTGQTQNMALYESAGGIVQRAAIQLGLGTNSDPYASNDPKWIQLCDALRSVVADLLKKNAWTNLQREVTFATASSATAYALPSDFLDFTNQTGWNRSSFLPMVGPLTPQESQFLKARLANVIINICFRQQGGLITFPIVPPNGTNVAFEYLSKFCVQTAAGSEPTKAYPTLSTDNVLFDPELLVAATKLHWARDRGRETSAMEDRFTELLEAAINQNAGAPSLSLGGRPVNTSFDRMLNDINIPEGNWGA